MLAVKVYLTKILQLYHVGLRDRDHEMNFGAILELTKPVVATVSCRS